MLSGHGCFGKYLFKIGKEDTSKFHHCGSPEDDVYQTLFVCPSWIQEKSEARNIMGEFEQHSMVELM